MKGTATITTKTTVTPVVVTEFRDAIVLSAGPRMVTVQGADGVRKRFSQDQLDERGIQILKDGRMVRISELHEGDALTATVISKAPPVVVTEKEVQATVGGSKAAPAPAMAAADPRLNPRLRRPPRSQVPPRRRCRRPSHPVLGRWGIC